MRFNVRINLGGFAVIVLVVVALVALSWLDERFFTPTKEKKNETTE